MTALEMIPERTLTEDVKHAFCENLKKVMSVATFDQDGLPKKITQHALSNQTEVARSTIAKYCSGKDANPDLDTICRLASKLNVSPALLLMTQRDWEALARAYMTIQDVVKKPEASELVKQCSKSREVRAKATIEFSKKANYRETAEKYLTVETHERLMQGIFATCELPDLKLLQGDADLIVFTMCVVLGARLIDKGRSNA